MLESQKYQAALRKRRLVTVFVALGAFISVWALTKSAEWATMAALFTGVCAWGHYSIAVERDKPITLSGVLYGKNRH